MIKSHFKRYVNDGCSCNPLSATRHADQRGRISMFGSSDTAATSSKHTRDREMKCFAKRGRARLLVRLLCRRCRVAVSYNLPATWRVPKYSSNLPQRMSLQLLFTMSTRSLFVKPLAWRKNTTFSMQDLVGVDFCCTPRHRQYVSRVHCCTKTFPTGTKMNVTAPVHADVVYPNVCDCRAWSPHANRRRQSDLVSKGVGKSRNFVCSRYSTDFLNSFSVSWRKKKQRVLRESRCTHFTRIYEQDRILKADSWSCAIATHRSLRRRC